MVDLISHFSISEIVLGIILLAIAIKACVEFIDWAVKRTHQAVDKANKPTELKEMIKKNEEELELIQKELKFLKESILLLIESDKDDIKYSITKDHHYFCYRVGSIDDYSLSCIEKRYSHYIDEGGNSFVEQLMQELRALPRSTEEKE